MRDVGADASVEAAETGALELGPCRRDAVVVLTDAWHKARVRFGGGVVWLGSEGGSIQARFGDGTGPGTDTGRGGGVDAVTTER